VSATLHWSWLPSLTPSQTRRVHWYTSDLIMHLPTRAAIPPPPAEKSLSPTATRRRAGAGGADTHLVSTVRALPRSEWGKCGRTQIDACSWAVYSIERSAAFATGFPAALADADITTPFARPLADIASVSNDYAEGPMSCAMRAFHARLWPVLIWCSAT
jgi:hypothetical protein